MALIVVGIVATGLVFQAFRHSCPKLSPHSMMFILRKITAVDRSASGKDDAVFQ
jgi:hypothetical protein